MTDRSETASRRRPQAFRLDAGRAPEAAAAPFDVPPARAPVDIELQPDAYVREAERLSGSALGREEAAIEAAQRQGMRRRTRPGWGSLFWSALGGLVSLGFGLWVSRLVQDLFDRAPALGWVGVGLLGLLGAAVAGLAIREAVGVFRQTKVARLHAALAAARLTDDRAAARRHVGDLAALYTHRPETARGRADVAEAAQQIVDGADLVDVAERALMLPLDRLVRAEIATAAKRVSVVTAISPRAILDLVFVVAQLVRLIRRIAELYSGRPGLLGFLKLARSVGSHLAVTGGMAVGDSLLQQVVGHGIAAKLSARLGEGVLNGLLTTRVGLSAMAVCRPMPFGIGKPPGVKDVAPFLFGEGKSGPS